MSRTPNPDRDLPDPAARETEADDEPGFPKTLTPTRRHLIDENGRDWFDASRLPLCDDEAAILEEMVRRYNAYDTLVARLKADRHTFAEYWRHHVLNGSHEKAMRNQAHVDAIDAALMKASKA